MKKLTGEGVEPEEAAQTVMEAAKYNGFELTADDFTGESGEIF